MKRNWRKGTGKLVHISRLNEFKNWWLKGQISSNRSYGKEREWCGISGVLCDQNLVLFGKWAVPFATPKGTSECLKMSITHGFLFFRCSSYNYANTIGGG